MRSIQPKPINPTQEYSLSNNIPITARYQPIAPYGGIQSNNSLEKKRSNRACDECRRKKIKCQKTEDESICKNCISSKIGCTYNTSLKRRGPPRGYINSLENRLEHIEELISGISGNSTAQHNSLEDGKDRKRIKTNSFKEDESTTKAVIETELPPEGRFISGEGVHYIISKRLRFLKDSGFAARNGFEIQHSETSDYFYVQKSISPNDRRERQIRELVTTGLLKSNETVKSIEDWIFRVAGIDKALSDQLLRIYFANIHPLLPVINKTVFLEEYRGIRTSFPAGPLLNAVYGAAVRFVENSKQFGDSESLNNGIPWRFPRNLAELLFENLVSFLKGKYSPSLSSIQAIIIAQNHSINVQSWNSAWLLNCFAIRMSQDIGLHRSTEGWDLSEEEKQTRRIVWWTVYLLDRWYSAGTGHPLTAFDEDCDESYPSENVSMDVVMDIATENDQHLPRFPSLDQDLADRVKGHSVPLNQPFIQLLKLSKILGRILQGLYSPRAKKHSEKYGSDAIVAYLDDALSKWRLSLPPLLQIAKPRKECTTNKTYIPIVSSSGLLSLSYYTLLILLYRPFIERVNKESNGMPEKDKLSSQGSLAICISAAIRIVEIAEHMLYRDFLMLSWGFALYPVFTAALIHIHTCSSSSDAVSKVAKAHLIRALAVVDKLCLLSPMFLSMAHILKKIVSISPFFQNDPEYLASINLQKGANPHLSFSDQEEKEKESMNLLEIAKNISNSERIDLIKSYWFPEDQGQETNVTKDRLQSEANTDWTKELYTPSEQTSYVQDPFEVFDTSPLGKEQYQQNICNIDAYSIRQFGLCMQAPEFQQQQQQAFANLHLSFSGLNVPPSHHEHPATNTLFEFSDFSFPFCYERSASNMGTSAASMNQVTPEWSINNQTGSTSNQASNNVSSEQFSSMKNQDPLAQFRHRPDNPFWAIPSSIELEEWKVFILQYQQQMKEI